MNRPKLTGIFFSLPASTLGTWFEKKRNISVWLPLVRNLSFEYIVRSIPKRQANNRYFLINEKYICTNKMMNDLKKYENRISFTQTKICFGASPNSQQLECSICILRVDKVSLIKIVFDIIFLQTVH